MAMHWLFARTCMSCPCHMLCGYIRIPHHTGTRCATHILNRGGGGGIRTQETQHTRHILITWPTNALIIHTSVKEATCAFNVTLRSNAQHISEKLGLMSASVFSMSLASDTNACTETNRQAIICYADTSASRHIHVGQSLPILDHRRPSLHNTF